MSIEAVRLHLGQWGQASRILELAQSSATVDLAAAALGCAPARIAKTLAFQVDGRPILVVAAGDVRIDNPKFKARFGTKAVLLPSGETEERTGHAAGGVCPFAVKEGVPVHLDVSLKRFDTVFPACGSANSAIEVTLPELERFSAAAGWVDVCRTRDP